MEDISGYVRVEFLLEANGVGWFESDDGTSSIDLPMQFVRTDHDGSKKTFRLTSRSKCFMRYDDDGGITFIAEEGQQAILLQTAPTEIGYEIKDIHIFQRYTKQ